MNSNKRKIISITIKLLITAGCILFLYKKTFQRHDIGSILLYFNASFSGNRSLYLILASLLMFVNWLIESFKWKTIIQPLEEITLKRSVMGVLSGVTVSIFTPNRLGEFGGRIFYLERADKVAASLYTWIAGASQLIITIFAGMVALLWYVPKYVIVTGEQHAFLHFVSIVSGVFFALMILFYYFNISVITNIVERISFIKKYAPRISVIQKLSYKRLTKVMTLSGLRYIVFTLQFYLLLLFFNIELPMPTACLLITLSFFATTAIPTFAFTELAVRGSTAVAFIGLLSPNHLGIVAASFSLWFINLAVPALIGLLFVFRMKFFKEPA